MFAVYQIVDGVFGYDDELIRDDFATEAEAEAYMAQCEAEDIEEYGEVLEPYYVDEVYC